MHGPAGIPGIVLNGTSEYLSIPDATYWTTAAGSTFSVVACIYPVNTAGTGTLMAKYTAAQEEWTVYILSDETVRFTITDTTAGVSIRRDSDGAVAVGTPAHLVFTYDGATNANGMVIYVNGVSVASTATNGAGFVTMRNNTSTVTMGAVDSVTPSNYLNATYYGGPWGPTFTQTQLTAAQVLNDYRLWRGDMGLG